MNLTLHPLEAHDFPLYWRLVSDPRVMSKIRPPLSLGEARSQFERNQARGDFRIDLDGEPVGTGKLSPEGEIGYMFLPEYWARGLGTAVCAQVLKLARERGQRSVFAWVSPDNVGSRKTLLRNGFSSKGLEPFAESLSEKLERTLE